MDGAKHRGQPAWSTVEMGWSDSPVAGSKVRRREGLFGSIGVGWRLRKFCACSGRGRFTLVDFEGRRNLPSSSLLTPERDSVVRP